MKDRFMSFMRRNAQTIPLTVIAFCIGGILLLQAVMIGELRKSTDQIKISSKHTEDRIEQVDRHLDCIVYFFSRSDRSDKAIADIETCQLKDEKPSKAEAPQPTPLVQPSPQAPQRSVSPQQAAPIPAPRPTTPSGNEIPEQAEPILNVPILDAVLKNLGDN